MSSELERELHAYKKVCEIAEQLLENAQLPRELMQKYILIKTLTIQKYQTNQHIEMSEAMEIAKEITAFTSTLNR